jgi:hypothetical protein
VTDGLFLPDGDGLVATIDTQGAWNPEHCHGCPVQGLMGWAVEGIPSLVPMQVTRLTHDMIRPVPIGKRLHLDTTVVREGKKIQVVEAVLLSDGVEHVRTRALRLRVQDASAAKVPESTPLATTPPPPLDEVPITEFPDNKHVPRFFRTSMQMRRFSDTLAFWARLTTPIVPGSPITPLVRVAAAGDLVNTIGVQIDPRYITTINPDVTLNIVRPPTGEWIAVQGATTFQPSLGIGLSVAEVHDEQGLIGSATAAQLVEAR